MNRYPGGSFWIWSFWWRNFKAGSCAGRVAKANLRREIYVGIQGQTWNVTFSCSTYLTEQYSLRKLSPKLVNLFKLGAWLSQRDLRNPLIWRHTHGIPFGVQSREWLETAAPLTLARWTNIWPNLRIELTYQLSKFSFSRNFHVLLSWKSFWLLSNHQNWFLCDFVKKKWHFFLIFYLPHLCDICGRGFLVAADRLQANCSYTGDPLHSRAACTQPCNVNTHSRAHCSHGARLCEQWGHGCVNNGARLCASARLCRGSPVS